MVPGSLDVAWSPALFDVPIPFFAEVTESVWPSSRCFSARRLASASLRAETGRGEKGIRGENLECVKKLVSKMFVETSYLSWDKMHPELAPSAWGLTKVTETVSTERGRAPTFRLHAIGTRQLVLAPFNDIKLYMERAGMQQITPDNVQGFFKGMSKDAIDSYLSNSGVLQHATIGPGEGILIPFNFLFAEKASTGLKQVGRLHFRIIFPGILCLTFWRKPSWTF